MEFLNLFEGSEDGVALIADGARRRRMIHLTVIFVDDVLHVGHELLLRLHQFSDNSSARKINSFYFIFIHLT